MPDFTPAPVSTITSPNAFIFLIVSGVAATRGSPGSVSAGTAIFMMPLASEERREGSDEEISHQAQQDDQKADAPFGQRDERRVGVLVFRIVVAVRRCVFDLTVVGHLDSPPSIRWSGN